MPEELRLYYYETDPSIKKYGIQLPNINRPDSTVSPVSPNMKTFVVSNSGASAYLIDNISNPTLNLVRGNQYIFEINAHGHPFWIQTSTTPYNS
jgi:hypothetical protein